MKKFQLAVVAAIATGAASFTASAQVSGDVVKIGFMTDMSGVYSDPDGKGGLEAIKMAIEDYGGKVLGKPIELLFADHQNKPDIGSSKAREWMDQQGLDVLIGGSNSGVALAVNKVAAEKKRVYINVGAATPRLTNEECTPYTVHYAVDTVALARGTGRAVVKNGGKNWFFLSADYAFGHSLESETAAVVKASGGQVLGAVRHPLGASDFSSFLLQAQASKADVLGLANAGSDTINAIKAAQEFGITKKMKIAALLMFINDVHTLGLKTTEGLLMTDSWYWDMNADTRKFANRYFAKMKKMPSSLQAADYSAVNTYLKAVEAAKTDDPDKVMVELKRIKINDFYKKGYIRQDGRGIHDMYLFEAKTPAESQKPWDYLKVVATIPGEQAFTTVEESKCTLLKKP